MLIRGAAATFAAIRHRRALGT